MLPTVPDGDGFPDLADLFAAAGVPTGVIAAPSVRIPGEPIYQVHTVVSTELPPAVWLDLDELDQLAHPAAVAAAIQTSVAEHRGDRPQPAGRPDWFRSGWLDGVDEWIDRVLADHFLTRAAPSVPVKWWSLSAVLRVAVASPTGSESLFFKAACDLFRAEPALTQQIDRLVPGVVPQLIDVEIDRGWMLMRAFEEQVVERDPEVAVPAAQTIARLQRMLVDHVDDFLVIGCPDRRLEPTLDGLASLVRDSLELQLLSEEERSAARAMEPWLASQVHALAEAGLPSSVGHGDLHLGNVARNAGHVVLFDWTDAAITFPVLDAALLAQSVGAAHELEVLDAYADVWREGYSDAQVRAALMLAPRVNRVYQAISYEGIYRAQERRSQWEVGGIVAKVLRELIASWRAAS